jgi:hypothetical protein
MRMRASLLPLVVLAALMGPFGPRRPGMSFDEASKAASANSASPDGKTYADDVARHFSEQHENSLNECAQAPGADGAPFTLAVKVNKKGVVEEVLVRPQTSMALCMARTAVKDHLKRPPRADYWVLIPFKAVPAAEAAAAKGSR